VLIEIDEKWMSERKYLDMSEYWQWRKTKEQEIRSVDQEAPAMKRVG
jgi:putative transposase